MVRRVDPVLTSWDGYARGEIDTGGWKQRLDRRTRPQPMRSAGPRRAVEPAAPPRERDDDRPQVSSGSGRP